MRERKPMDPALRSFLDAQAAAAGPMPSFRCRVGKRAADAHCSRAGEPLVHPRSAQQGRGTRRRDLRGAFRAPVHAGALRREKLPVLVYLHGGGWVAGSVATHDPFCRLLSEAAGVIIASVEYRLAPEHPHPAALEDAFAAVHWAANNAARWGGDAGRLALGGDSSGGHLAAVTANRLCATR